MDLELEAPWKRTPVEDLLPGLADAWTHPDNLYIYVYRDGTSTAYSVLNGFLGSFSTLVTSEAIGAFLKVMVNVSLPM